MRSPNHPQELDRLAFLQRLDILDTRAERVYDDFVRLAAAICEVPISLVSLVAQERQWFKARLGLAVSETSRTASLCSHAILRSEPLIVEDATKDPRFVDNELVTGEVHLRFYAGVPLSVEGYPLGTLCVIDRKPRRLSQTQVAALGTLGRQLSRVLEMRLAELKSRETTDRLEMIEGTLQTAKARFEYLFHNVAAAIYTTDLDGVVFEINAEAARLFNKEPKDVLGAPEKVLWGTSASPEELAETRARIIQGEIIRNQERALCRPDGETATIVFSSHAMRGPSGAVTGLMGVYHDISDRKKIEGDLTEANVSLERLAYTDVLTKMSNRRGILEFLDVSIAQLAEKVRPVSVIMLDIDHFKRYNDEFGHLAGDDALQQVGSVLLDNCRAADRVGRYGGEEFLVVLPRADERAAHRTAERLRRAIERHAWVHRPVTASLGVATLSADCPDAKRLLSVADARLYAAKALGRNRVVSIGIDSHLAEDAGVEGSCQISYLPGLAA